MKNIIIFISILFVTTAAAQSDRFSVTVEGLGCPFCAYGLEKKFKEMDGVKSIKIDIETGLMTFMADASKNLSIEKVSTQVDKAGYTAKVVKIERASGKVETSVNEQTSAADNQTTETFKVYGSCGMCKTRIESAVTSMEGVTAADWNTASKMLTIQFDAKKIDLNDIHKKVASVGHDTDKVVADASVYESLPGCCHYDRKSGK